MSASEAIAEAGPAIPFVDPESLDPETRALHDRIGAAIGYDGPVVKWDKS